MNAFTIIHSKTHFEYLNPRLEMIFIEDIAHALSHICRFTGHVNSFYSVAQHSIIVSGFVSKKNQLWGLLHDAPEAYVNDLSTPLKKIIGGNYCFIHELIMNQICQKYELPLKIPEEVNKYDRIITVNEMRILIDPSYEENGIPRILDYIDTWSSEKAKYEFLKKFRELSEFNEKIEER